MPLNPSPFFLAPTTLLGGVVAIKFAYRSDLSSVVCVHSCLKDQSGGKRNYGRLAGRF